MTETWAEVTPEEAAPMFAGYPERWWIAGGWSIDLFLGNQTRQHGDIDIAVLRDEQRLLRAHFSDWDMQVAHDGKLSPWQDGDRLAAPRHQFWARPRTDGRWALEFLLEDREDGDWLFRRDPRVRLPIDQLGRTTQDGVPYVCPEVSLLYKAKHADVERNTNDFDAVLPRLDDRQRAWLRSALELAHPGHLWIADLAVPDRSQAE
ncbi:MAG: amino acid transporter [Dehalococcoidia bacterium]